MGILKKEVVVAVLAVLGAEFSLAQNQNYPMSVNALSMGESALGAPAAGMVSRAQNETVTIKIHNSCFPTNLRGVPNPLAPSSIIKANFDLKIGASVHKVWVEYPASLVTAAGMSGATVSPMSTATFSTGTISSAAIYGNTVVLKTPYKSGISVDDEGKITKPVRRAVSLSDTAFTQTVTDCNTGPVWGQYGWSSYVPTYGCGDFMGKNGTVTASVGGIAVSADNSTIEFNVAYPGQTGFCGGYWSPLMVFIDERRPSFENSSKFPLNPGGETMWPQADHAGWFVALDRDGSGTIEHKDELFGESKGFANGFEVLKLLDSNNDHAIDGRDKAFKQLLLWKDANGDGVSQKDELQPLSKKITRISLKYNNDSTRLLGKYAEERERSVFWYRGDKGEAKKGDIVDVWIAPK